LVFFDFSSERKNSQLVVYWYKYLFSSLFSNLGVHIGHSLINTLRQAAWMIYGFKWDLSIINLGLTVSAIKSAFVLACGCALKMRPFWFVTQDLSFHRYSRYLAIKCGEFSSTSFWIRGMASNFSEVTFNFFTRKPSYVFLRKDFLLESNFENWFLTRLSWPGGMLVSSVFASRFATRDALKGFVGCVGLLDTNADSHNCVLAVPANDDSVDWIVFINDVFSEYILFKKMWAVLRWYYFLLKRPNNYPFFEHE
jgi:ribosomal protein S2